MADLSISDRLSSFVSSWEYWRTLQSPKDQQISIVTGGERVNKLRKVSEEISRFRTIARIFVLGRGRSAPEDMKVKEEIANTRRQHPRRFDCQLQESGNPVMCMKWYVNDDASPGRPNCPRCCVSPAYVISGNLLSLVHDTSRRTPFFWIDEAYVMGLLARKVSDVHYKLHETCRDA